MIVRIEKSFERDTDEIHDKELLKRITEITRTLQSAKTLSEVPQIKKMEGFKNFFRIRTGDFRIGFEFINGEIHFLRFLNRKDMYKKFPSK